MHWPSHTQPWLGHFTVALATSDSTALSLKHCNNFRLALMIYEQARVVWVLINQACDSLVPRPHGRWPGYKARHMSCIDLRDMTSWCSMISVAAIRTSHGRNKNMLQSSSHPFPACEVLLTSPTSSIVMAFSFCSRACSCTTIGMNGTAVDKVAN